MKKRKNLRYLRSLCSRKLFSFPFLSWFNLKFYHSKSNLLPYKNIFNYFHPLEEVRDSQIDLNYTNYGLFWTSLYRVLNGWVFFFNPKKKPTKLFAQAWLTRYGPRNFVFSSYGFPRSWNNYLPLSLTSFRYIIHVMVSGFEIRTVNNVITGPSHSYSQSVASSLSHVLHDTRYRAFEFLFKEIPSAVSYMHPRDIFNYTFLLYSKISTRTYYMYVKLSYKAKNFFNTLFFIFGIFSRNLFWFWRLLKTVLLHFVFFSTHFLKIILN